MLDRLMEKVNVMSIMLRKWGPIGTIRLVWSDVLFDLRYGVDTYTPVPKDELFPVGKRLELQNRYVPSTFGIVATGIAEAKVVLGEDIAQASGFIDFGSGKGKVLIAAAKAGFRNITGIEYSEDLHRVASANLKVLGLEEVARSIHGDAACFFPRPEDRVLYFFNPFEGEILEACLINIKSIAATGPRILIVFNPVADATYSRHFKKLAEKSMQPGNARYNIYTDG